MARDGYRFAVLRILPLDGLGIRAQTSCAGEVGLHTAVSTLLGSTLFYFSIEYILKNKVACLLLYLEYDVSCFWEGCLFTKCHVVVRTVSVLMRVLCFCLSFCLLMLSLEADRSRESVSERVGIISNEMGVAAALTRAEGERMLRRVVLDLDDRSCEGLSVGLYDTGSEGVPGNLLITLAGPMKPSKMGQYTFECEGGYCLESGQVYWIVASVDTPGAVFRYKVKPTEEWDPSDVGYTKFLTFHEGRPGAPLTGVPSFTAEFSDPLPRLAVISAGRNKFLWTAMLVGLIGFCCWDLLPRNQLPNLR